MDQNEDQNIRQLGGRTMASLLSAAFRMNADPAEAHLIASATSQNQKKTRRKKKMKRWKMKKRNFSGSGEDQR
ncbi:uncharacterized protein A4U43_C01F22990 [Asparagus officinalis]|uniref:Uncharacterized protein n=1 Tax=Asparagus officinalis TaxID=4686 RepID=A0A5P1FVQ9_ASPOF|nr:uncharacterized protein A4U43_C01F22990 [Asparagus officinalis]